MFYIITKNLMFVLLYLGVLKTAVYEVQNVMSYTRFVTLCAVKNGDYFKTIDNYSNYAGW